jgi:thymidine kinase
MAKLYFRYGAMGSAKTLNLLAVRHNYDQQGKRVLLIKPAVDDRFGKELIRSRAGLEYPADLMVGPQHRLDREALRGLACILVDECQFLSGSLVEQLREVTFTLDIPVIAYGLRTDFQARLFPGSQRLMELADTIEEVKTTCKFCNRKAVFNLRHDALGRAIVDGPTVMLGADACYSPTCYPCYQTRTQAAVCEPCLVC